MKKQTKCKKCSCTYTEHAVYVHSKRNEAFLSDVNSKASYCNKCEEDNRPIGLKEKQA